MVRDESQRPLLLPPDLSWANTNLILQNLLLLGDLDPRIELQALKWIHVQPSFMFHVLEAE